MISKPVYIYSRRWTKRLINELKADADGIILGDLFCQKRMFKNEIYDIIEYSEYARSLNLQVILQSPVYNTDKNIGLLINTIDKLHEMKILNAVFLHDVGLLNILKKYDNILLWWDRFSFNRDYLPNLSLLDFLMMNGITSVEVQSESHLNSLSNHNCKAILYYYGPSIISFGRRCLTEYMLNEVCGNKILCATHQPSIMSKEGNGKKYKIDGYTLQDGIYESGVDIFKYNDIIKGLRISIDNIDDYKKFMKKKE